MEGIGLLFKVSPVKTFGVSTCARKKTGPDELQISHRSALVHVRDKDTAEEFARYLLNANYPTSEGWIHVGYSITSPDDVMSFPDIKGNVNN